MKKIITLLILTICINNSIFSQKKIEASTILNDIKNGKNISIENATIIGVLDLTFMDDALKNVPKKKKNSWFNWSSNNNSNTNEIKKLISVKISFKNCTFNNDVLAYIPTEESGYTFTASFEEEVIFKNCEFTRKAMFKYSDFYKDSDFSYSTFNDDNTFKYAKFLQKSNFYKTKFNEVATFKYAKFSENVSFANAIFKDTATFKYTQFKNGVSFNNTQFKEDLNIKYMNVSGGFDITGMDVNYEIDSKYTKINGKNFNKYLINNK